MIENEEELMRELVWSVGIIMERGRGRMDMSRPVVLGSSSSAWKLNKILELGLDSCQAQYILFKLGSAMP